MVQWTVEIPEDIDPNVRELLRARGGAVELSTFVREAVGGELLRRTIRDIQEDNRDLSPEEAQGLADDAVAWANIGKN